MDPEKIRRLTEKYTSREIIKTNVDKETGDRIRARRLPGVKVDEDYRRYYPFQTLASHVLGFTGSDNQGIIGLEVMYDSVLKGINGRILTQTDARGMELDAVAEERVEPQPGNDLVLSLNIDLQTYAEQAAKTVMEEKQARQVSVILMNGSLQSNSGTLTMARISPVFGFIRITETCRACFSSITVFAACSAYV